MKKAKKLAAVVLTAVLAASAFTAMPVSAYAAESTTAVSDSEDSASVIPIGMSLNGLYAVILTTKYSVTALQK